MKKKDVKKSQLKNNSPQKPKILVFAYHQIGYLCLKQLLEAKENVIGLFTHKPNRQENIWFKTPDTLAKKHKIPTYYDANLTSEKTKLLIIKKLQPDLVLSIFFREKIPNYILEYTKGSAFNLHGSYLPYYRGRVPLNWALINGEKFAGASMHYLTDKFDTGAILARAKIPITSKDDINSLYNKFHKIGLRLFKKTIKDIKNNKIKPLPQNDAQATYFSGRKPEDGVIKWTSMPAEKIYNLIRGVTFPYPGAFTYYDTMKFIFWRAKIIENNKWRLPPGAGIYKADMLHIGCHDGKLLQVTDFAVLQKNKPIDLPTNLKILMFTDNDYHYTNRYKKGSISRP